MKLSDYVMQFIENLGVKDVFCVTGGGAMHLNNSLGGDTELNGVFMLNEQGAAIAAEAYARIREGYGVCLVTSGPGATNAITGLCGAYMDSIPVIFISGQAKTTDLVGDQRIRQFGIQEVDIISMVEPYTKYCVQVKKPEEIRYDLEKMTSIAASGRPGAVWIDIPLDIQAADVNPEELVGYDSYYEPESELKINDGILTGLINRFNQSKRPALILGNGIRLSHAVDLSRELVDVLGIPVFVSWNGVDLIEDDHPLYYGRPNVVGHRSSNIILQNADFVLSIGTRLSLLNTGYNYDGYLKNAYHVMVDIDPFEMEKKSLHPQLKIECDAAKFINELLSKSELINSNKRTSWSNYCKSVREKYPVRISEQSTRDGYVSIYQVYDVLSDKMKCDDVFQFASSGTSVDIGMKMLRLKKGQRAFLNKSMAAMGYDVPACIGSCIGSGRKRTICVTGDGSIVMNMQELEVIKRLNLPIKIFVVDNGGYSMIWHSQNSNFMGHLTGCTNESGLTLPNMKDIAEAFGIKGMEVNDESDLEEIMSSVLDYNGPVVCRINADIMQKVTPKQSSFMNDKGQMESRPLQDMEPLLEREEYNELMVHEK